MNSEYENESRISAETGRDLSGRMSHHRSISRGSSGVGNSSHHSVNVSDHLPSGLGSAETTSAEPEGPLDKTSENTQEVPLRRLAYLNKPEIPVLIAGTISAILNGVILPIFGVLFASMIKTFYEPPHKLKRDASFWAVMFVLLGLAKMIVFPSQTYFFAVAGCKLIRRIRSLCFEKVVRMEVGWFEKPENSSGAIGARLSSEAASVRALVGDKLGQTVHDGASAVAGLAIAFAACWQLAFIVVALLPLMGLNWYTQIKFLSGFSKNAKVCTSCLTSLLLAHMKL